MLEKRVRMENVLVGRATHRHHPSAHHHHHCPPQHHPPPAWHHSPPGTLAPEDTLHTYPDVTLHNREDEEELRCKPSRHLHCGLARNIISETHVAPAQKPTKLPALRSKKYIQTKNKDCTVSSSFVSSSLREPEGGSQAEEGEVSATHQEEVLLRVWSHTGTGSLEK